MLLQTPKRFNYKHNQQHNTHDRSHQEQHQHILQWCYNSSPSQVSCKHLRIVIDIIDATQITNIAGYSVISHDNRTSHLRMDENVCLEKIATEEALVETFRREGDEMKNKYKSWYKALGLCNHHVEIASISGRMMRHETWSPEQRSDESVVQIQSNGRTIGRCMRCRWHGDKWFDQEENEDYGCLQGHDWPRRQQYWWVGGVEGCGIGLDKFCSWEAQQRF